MPFYEYQCKSCGHTLEAMQKVNDPPLKKCPHCAKSQLTRLMSAPVFRLKGGGWYETDFKGEQDHKKNLADRPDADSSSEEKKPAAEAGAGDGAAASKDAASPAEKAAAKPAEKAPEKPVEKAASAEPAKKASASETSKPAASGSQGSKKSKKAPSKAAGRR